MKRWRVWVLTWALASCTKPTQPEREPVPAVTRVHCALTTRGSVPDERVLRGVVSAAPDAYALIAAQVSGRITRIKVREGDSVKAGQGVAEVESRSYRDALAQASAQLAQAEALVRHDATLVAREQRLFERGISARQQLEAASVNAEHDTAGAALARATVDAAKLNLEHTTLRSPIAGTVLRVLRHQGELSDGSPATAMLEVADPQKLEFAASAAPLDLMALRLGQPALARFGSLQGSTFPLRVSAVTRAVDPATGVGSVRFAFAVSDAPPPLGLFGEATVRVGERPDVLFAPAAALRNPSGSGAEVVVCDGAAARVRSVKLGARVGPNAEIVEGLKAGEHVAIDQVLGLEDGATIEVVQ